MHNPMNSISPGCAVARDRATYLSAPPLSLSREKERRCECFTVTSFRRRQNEKRSDRLIERSWTTTVFCPWIRQRMISCSASLCEDATLFVENGGETAPPFSNRGKRFENSRNDGALIARRGVGAASLTLENITQSLFNKVQRAERGNPASQNSPGRA